ncbi:MULTISPECIES: DUF4280 domain-containing protein [unclassified Chryseobacterium]|uniref:DUF4280 domain-containing protein n=1 Tax=unclassified Chryseobacterium TaxID=2593645 RepID=UPI0019241A80|nr:MULTISPECIES: DUF4280 domain-containing protein [unclassified Chryseobacterium]MBL3549160.1 DUF4280 domain-containing protein [Chryseobacterium sp. KMC2]
MAKKYVPEGAFLACDKGTSPSTLRVSFNKNTTIYDVPMATEADKFPFFHLKPMGLCTCPAKWATGVTCLPTTLQWDNPKDGVKINGNRMLLEDSTCNCIFGGKISIFFDRATAVAYGVGEGKMPSDYIKEGFDWLEQKTKESRADRNKMIPDWMKPIAGAKDWFDDLGTGLVEGAVNGVVGLGEVIYQVGQDPVGTAEAIGGMVKDGYKGVKDAYTWTTTPGNLEKAANDSWEWANKEENWDKLGDDIVKGAQKTGDWIANNPRKIGNTVGEFIPDAVAAVYTAGGSVAATAGKTVLKEGAEVVVEKTVKEVAEAGAEKVGKEALEAGAKKGIKETLEQLAKKESDDIAAVVTREADELAADALKQADDLGDDVLKKSDDVANKGDDAVKAIPPWKGPTDYSGINTNRFKIKPNADFTPAQKKAIYDANMKHNDGILRSDLDGTVLEMPQKSVKGVTPSQTEAQVDHIKAKSKGGRNDPSNNAQVLSREQNRAKWDS